MYNEKVAVLLVAGIFYKKSILKNLGKFAGKPLRESNTILDGAFSENRRCSGVFIFNFEHISHFF